LLLYIFSNKKEGIYLADEMKEEEEERKSLSFPFSLISFAAFICLLLLLLHI
jgi:hypothetical protein